MKSSVLPLSVFEFAEHILSPPESLCCVELRHERLMSAWAFLQDTVDCMWTEYSVAELQKKKRKKKEYNALR